VLSRAWYVLGGIALAVALGGSGYYLGRAHTLDRWALERAALADSADSARARAARASHALTDAGRVLDSLLTAYGALANRPPRVVTIHDATPDTVRDTVRVATGPAVPLPSAAPDTSAAARLLACDAVVQAAIRYRTACEAAQDSLTQLLAIATARRPASSPRRFSVVAGPGLSLTTDGRVHGALSVTAGWRLW